MNCEYNYTFPSGDALFVLLFLFCPCALQPSIFNPHFTKRESKHYLSQSYLQPLQVALMVFLILSVGLMALIIYLQVSSPSSCTSRYHRPHYVCTSRNHHHHHLPVGLFTTIILSVGLITVMLYLQVSLLSCCTYRSHYCHVLPIGLVIVMVYLQVSFLSCCTCRSQHHLRVPVGLITIIMYPQVSSPSSSSCICRSLPHHHLPCHMGQVFIALHKSPVLFFINYTHAVSSFHHLWASSIISHSSSIIDVFSRHDVLQ